MNICQSKRLGVVTGVTCIQAHFLTRYYKYDNISSCQISNWILDPLCPRFARRCNELHFALAPKPFGLETRTPRFGTDLRCDLRSGCDHIFVALIRGCCHAEPFCRSCISKEVRSSVFSGLTKAATGDGIFSGKKVFKLKHDIHVVCIHTHSLQI